MNDADIRVLLGIVLDAAAEWGVRVLIGVLKTSVEEMRECPSCGASCSPRTKFCRKCRTPLGGDAIVKTSERDPRSYTPKHLAEKILTRVAPRT